MSSNQTDLWTFHNPVRIHAGTGALAALPTFLRGDGEVLLVASPGFRRRGGMARVESLLQRETLDTLEDIRENPDLSDVERQLARLSSREISDVVAIGGGSVIDTAKLIAAGLGMPDVSLRRCAESGEALPARRVVRVVAVPTTAGTGSEVTPFATVWDHAAKRKYSIAGETMFPDVALLDPELTLTLPEEITISTGLDALTQAFESTWSRRANPVSNAFAMRAIREALGALPALRERPGDISLRTSMLEASLLAGLAISHTRTALCHSISYPITARFGLPHGLACAMTLPEVFAFNRAADEPRFERLAREAGFHSADKLHAHLKALLTGLEVGAHVRRCVPSAAAVVDLAPEMLHRGRADNNLRAATVDDVAMIVAEAYQGRVPS